MGFRDSLKILLLLVGALSSASLEAKEVTFGPEFEFTRASLLRPFDASGRVVVRDAMEELRKVILEKCKTLYSCEWRTINVGKWSAKEYIVTLPDGAWFKLSIDPGCVEITAKPMTVSQWRKNQAVLDDLIFGSAKSAGLFIDSATTHHINFGAKSAFEGNAEAFLRFYVDYSNRPDLALGGLGSDPKNGAPLSLLSAQQREELKAIVQEFENGKHQSILRLVKQIKKRVHNQVFFEAFGKNNPMHYQALGLKHLLEELGPYGLDPPVELRAVWAKMSLEDYIRTLELVEARLKFLDTQKGRPIFYLGLDKKSYHPSEIVSRLYVYVAESGLDFESYRFLLRDIYAETGLDPFFKDSSPLDARLKSLLKDYSDLLDVSPWTRALAENLANEALKADETSLLGREVLEKINAVRDREEAALAAIAARKKRNCIAKGVASLLR